MYIEIIEAKVFRTFIKAYFLLRNKRISINIKLTLHNRPVVAAVPRDSFSPH
jgi:hypothetical protein